MTLIAQIYPNVRTPKNMVSSISKRSRFLGFLRKQHGKLAQTLLKFERQHLYHIDRSMCRQLICKKRPWVTCKISKLSPNKLSADGKYSLLNWDNLTQHIQMQLSQKQKAFCEFFCKISKSSLNFEHLQKKTWLW